MIPAFPGETKMTFGSLFSGIGGLDLGLERAGMECRWQVEIDPFCQQVLAKHWPLVPKFGDIQQLTGGELERVDFLVGGYPCQPFSQAGKRGGADDPRHLWPEFARLIRILRPRGVLLENVPGHLSLGFGEVLGDLAGLGFDAEWLCLRASDFGASHLRKRVFVVAYAEHKGPSQGRPEGGSQPAPDFTGGRSGSNSMAYADGPQRWPHDERRRRGGEGRDGQRQEAGGFSQHGPPLVDVPDSGSQRLSDTRQAVLEGPSRECERPIARRFCSSFAPGPSDPQWPDILAERPDLAPALESPLRGMADGVPALVDRTKRLKALGNAVVPQVAQWIGERIMESFRPVQTQVEVQA